MGGKQRDLERKKLFSDRVPSHTRNCIQNKYDEKKETLNGNSWQECCCMRARHLSLGLCPES